MWVELDVRKSGVGAALVDRAAQDAFRLGLAQVYLCATPDNSGYYEKVGWDVLERDVAGLNIFVRRASAV